MSSKTKTTATKDETTQPLVPKLRFPEFREAGEWSSKKLSEVCLLITNGKANAQDHEEDGEYPLFDRSAVVKKSSLFLFDTEAVIIPGEGMRFAPKYFRGKFNLHQRAYALMKHLGDARFVYHALDYSQDALAEMAVKSTVLSLRLPIVENFAFNCPSLPEQARIADCLSSLDELLTAQARKIEALKTHKKGLMEQLFPREGETQPRLRFPEFQDAGEWITMPLGNAATFYNGRAYKQEELLESGKYTVLRVGNFFTNNSWYHSDLELDETKYCDTGDLLYAWSASFGPRIWGGAKVIYHYHIWKVVEHRDILRRFLFIVLENETEQMKSNSANGLGLLHITKGTIEAWQASFPAPAEQARIADCLSSLDDLIAAETRTHEALKTHKKGLMQQLFPSPQAMAQP